MICNLANVNGSRVVARSIFSNSTLYTDRRYKKFNYITQQACDVPRHTDLHVILTAHAESLMAILRTLLTAN